MQIPALLSSGEAPEFHGFVRLDDDERDRHIEEERAMTGTSCEVGVEFDPRERWKMIRVSALQRDAILWTVKNHSKVDRSLVSPQKLGPKLGPSIWI